MDEMLLDLVNEARGADYYSVVKGTSTTMTAEQQAGALLGVL